MISLPAQGCNHGHDITLQITENKLQWALTYQQHGWAVIPMHNTNGHACTCKDGVSCTNQGKHPRIRWKEFQEERPTEKQLREWWGRWRTPTLALSRARFRESLSWT